MNNAINLLLREYWSQLEQPGEPPLIDIHDPDFKIKITSIMNKYILFIFSDLPTLQEILNQIIENYSIRNRITTLDEVLEVRKARLRRIIQERLYDDVTMTWFEDEYRKLLRGGKLRTRRTYKKKTKKSKKRRSVIRLKKRRYSLYR